MKTSGQGIRLAVVLLNWNHSIETLITLSRIQSWNLSPLIIVVDNASTENEREILQEKAEGIILIQNSQNRGYAGGNNVGVQNALEKGCEYVLLLNADAEVSEVCVKSLLSILEKERDTGLIGPLLKEGEVLYAGGRDIGIYSNTRIPYHESRDEPQIISVDYIPGTVFLVKSEVFRTIGSLSEDYFFSGEIADFCRRSRDEGYRCAIYTGCTAIHHIHRSSWRDFIYPYYSLRNRFLYVRRHGKFFYFGFFRWWAHGMMHKAFAYVKGNRQLACALNLAMKDGIQGIYGNQHERIKAACHHCYSELEWNALA